MNEIKRKRGRPRKQKELFSLPIIETDETPPKGIILGNINEYKKGIIIQDDLGEDISLDDPDRKPAVKKGGLGK
jgi:hypothetical protein